MQVVTSHQMKQIEKNSLNYNLTYARLMENAGSAAAAFIRRTFQVEGLNCMIFSGKGGNGGDGFVVARKLFEYGANVVIVLVEGQPATEEASSMLNSAEFIEIPIFDLERDQGRVKNCLEQADIVVDAIYGTGFHGDLGEGAALACRLIGGAIAAVIALDLPSGVECDSGQVREGAVKADFTVAFDSLKPVHIFPSGQAACGQVEVVDIGIPPEARAGISVKFGAVTAELVAELLPERPPDSHKGMFGHLLAICGSRPYRGAAALSVLGALRTGVGLCTLASVEEVCAAVAAKLYEPILLPLPANQEGGIEAEASIPLLRSSMDKYDVVLFGCGVSNSPDTGRLLTYLVRTTKVPLIIDADGINALAGNIHVLQEAGAPIILTPHPGEMARLCGYDARQVQEDRCGAASAFASKWGVTVVLKGHETVIASPDGGLLINRTGGPGLAKGGSGDVLAGMLGSFLAQGMEPADAGACAVYLHGLAADRTARRLGDRAMLPSELLQDLPGLFLELRQ